MGLNNSKGLTEVEKEEGRTLIGPITIAASITITSKSDYAYLMVHGSLVFDGMKKQEDVPFVRQ